MDRRTFLKSSAVAAGTFALVGCDALTSGAAKLAGGGLPASIVPPDGAAVDPVHHLLNRAAFGPWPGDVERVRAMGTAAWIEEQLAPDSIDDTAASIRSGFVDLIHADPSVLVALPPDHVERNLVTWTILRAVYSRAQLRETMTAFWTDHFNIAIGKAHCRWLKTGDDRDVVRTHALGNFRTLVRASALSPAMLTYLDGSSNIVRTDRTRRRGKYRDRREPAEPGEDKPDVANENYARELMELHTLGVHAGYTQKDVQEAARCLTGWSGDPEWHIRTNADPVNFGEVKFVAGHHDDGEKTVLGKTIAAGGGEKDLDSLLEILFAHPACASFLATKLCRYYVSDAPPPALVERVAAALRAKDATTGETYEIANALRTIFASAEFAASAGAKLKRPFRLLVSSLRAFGADTDALNPLGQFLERMGQAPFQFPTPDGYPHETYPWLGTMLWRWNFALSLVTGRINGTAIDFDAFTKAVGGAATGADLAARVMAHLYGRKPSAAELDAVAGYLNAQKTDGARRRAAALAIAAPAFQRH